MDENVREFPQAAQAPAQTQGEHRAAPRPQQPRKKKKTKRARVLQRRLIVLATVLVIFFVIFSMGSAWGKGRGTKLTNENVTTQLAALFNVGWLTAVADAVSTGWVNWILTVLLIVFFAYFYTSMVFNPEETADNLRKQGGFIPGVRPGTATVQYIKNVLHRVTLPGGIFIAVIAVVPTVIFYFTGNQLVQAFGGTSILIMIGVALDTMSKVESQLKMHNYDGFFK